jgi:electron transport complex protein RnfC
MGLEPYILATYSGRRMWDAATARNVIDCIECGACSYVCPTKRPLLQLIRVGKSAAMSKGAK